MAITGEFYFSLEITPDGDSIEKTIGLPKLKNSSNDGEVWDHFIDSTYKSLLKESPLAPDEVGGLLRKLYIEETDSKSAKMPENQSMIIEGEKFPTMNYYFEKYGEKSYSTFQEYVGRIFNVEEKDEEKLIALNQSAIREIEALAGNPDTATKEIQDAKEMLGALIHQYYLDVNILVDPEKFEDLRQEVIDSLNYFEDEDEDGEYIHRTDTLIALNGQVLAGKGTTMGILELEAPVETGTAGILGAGPNHEHWSESSKLTQFPRDEGFIPPDKLVGTMFMIELLKRREDLDEQGKEDSPVVMSGFPRTEDQANQLDGVDGIKAVYMDMTATENAKRTIRRIVETIAGNSINDTNEAIRGDDTGSLFLSDETGSQLSEDKLIEKIKGAISLYGAENLVSLGGESTFNIGSTLIAKVPELNQIFEDAQLAEKARWHTYNKTKAQISKALENIGVEQRVVMVDEKSPKQVAQEVKGLI